MKSVSNTDHAYISRVLDVGAQGIMVAHVNSAAKAREIVEAALSRPFGHRSTGDTLPSLGCRPVRPVEGNQIINRETLIMPMIEIEEGLANVEAITAVPGIDTLHIGAIDLSVKLDLPGEVEHPRLRDAFARVAAAAQANNLSMGLGGARGKPKLQADLLRLGAPYLTCGTDTVNVLAAGWG